MSNDLLNFLLKPYFYTLQDHLSTRNKQIQIWCFIVYKYFLNKKIKEISVSELNRESFKIFHNEKVKRNLNSEFINLILNELENKNKIKFKDNSKTVIFILKMSLEELSDNIYNFAKNNRLINKIETIYFFTSGEFNENEVFYGYPEEIIIESLKLIENKGKAKIIEFEGKINVKFL